MHKQIKELTEAAIGGTGAMVGYIAKFGALGLAAAAGINKIKEFAQSINEIGRLGESLGVPATHIKNIVDQLKEHGASQKEATDEVRGFTEALVEMGRIGSPQYQALLQRAGAYSQAMANVVAQMEKVNEIEDKMNVARQAAQNVQKNRYEQDIRMGKSDSEAKSDAAKAANEFLGALKLHLDTQQRIEGQIRKMTPEQLKQQDELLKKGREVADQWDKVATSAEHAGGAMLQAFGPSMVAVMDALTGAIDKQIAKMNEIPKQLRELKEYLAKGDIPGAILGRKGGPGTDTPLKPLIEINPSAPWSPARIPGALGLGAPTPGSFNDRWGGLPKMARGGIVSRPTVAMIGEAGPEAVVPLGGQGGRATEDNTRETEGNTKQLTRLNDMLFEILHPVSGAINVGAGALGGLGSAIGGALGGGGGGGSGSAPGGGSAPYGSDAGPGTGAGAGAGTGGGGGSGPNVGEPAPPKNERGAALYQKLLTEFQKNPPQGLPPDAARFGITKGTPEEWARFGTSVAHAESGFNPKLANTSDTGGSFGAFQYAHGQVPGGNAYDTDASVKAFVRDANASAVNPKGLRGGILGQRFSTIGKHPDRGAAYLSHASKLGGAGAARAPSDDDKGLPPATPNVDPAAFIMHHTERARHRRWRAGNIATAASRRRIRNGPRRQHYCHRRCRQLSYDDRVGAARQRPFKQKYGRHGNHCQEQCQRDRRSSRRRCKVYRGALSEYTGSRPRSGQPGTQGMGRRAQSRLGGRGASARVGAQGH